jgi:predicted nuclease of predicted toxin-antitoxin system
VKLLLDENLSPRLPPRLSSLFPELIHVREVGLKQASDEIVWTWAKEHGYTVVTTDADFVTLSTDRGHPPKVVHLEECDFPLRVIEGLLRQNAVRILAFVQDSHAGLLSLAASTRSGAAIAPSDGLTKAASAAIGVT